MKQELAISLITVTILAISLIISASYTWADDKDYCYDQVGDGHNCYETKKKCRNEQKHDEIAESHCYNEDRT